MAVSERDALNHTFASIRKAKNQLECKRSVLVGHNSFLAF